MSSPIRKLLVALFAIGWAMNGLAQVTDVDHGCDRLTATGNPEYPPYLWRSPDEPGRLIGANALIFEEISVRLGVPIDLLYVGPWSRSQEEVRAGRVDLMAGAFLTLARLEYMDYIYPAFLMTRSVVWTRHQTDLGYTDRADLIPHRGSTVIHNSFGQVFDQYMEDHLSIEPVASLEQAFRMLAQSRVDYVLYEDFPGQAYANRLGLEQQLKSLEPPVSQEALYLGVSHRSACNTGQLRGRLAQIMLELEQEGFNHRALEQGLVLWQEQNPQNSN